MKTTLISSKDYGKTLKEVSDLEYRQKREAYDLLLDQTPKLGDFIPCDKEGKPLEKPLKKYFDADEYEVENPHWNYKNHLKQYQEALERVKFEGFEVKFHNCKEFKYQSEVIYFNLHNKDYYIKYNCHWKTFSLYFDKDYHSIISSREDLTTLGLTLKNKK